MKVKTTMRQMKEAKVDFISLVTRGANRIPFRTIKSEGEHEMLDLSKPLRMFKGEKPASASPVIAGLALLAHDDATMASIATALKAEGLEFSKTQKNEDGTVVLCNEGEDLSVDTHVVRLSDNVAVVMKGFSPYSDSLSTSATFAEQVAAQGFYQGLRTANEAVYSTIANILYKSDSPTDASGKIAATLDAYKQYVTTLVKGLPAVAFKAEKAVDDVLAKKAEDDAKAAAAATAKKEEKPEGGEAAGNTEAKKEDGAAAAPAAPEAAKKEGEKDKAGETANDQTQAAGAGETGAAAGAETAEKGDGSAEAKKADDPMAVLMQKLEDLSKDVKGVSEQVDTVAKAQKSTEEKVAELTQKAENTAKAVKSTVVAGASAGDEPARVGQAKKSENDDPRTGCFDTAFLPGRRI